MIPRVLHLVHLGDAPLPDIAIKSMDTAAREWGWRVKVWTNFTDLDNQRDFDAAPLLSEKSDIARFEVLWREGGFYIDTDVELLRSFDDLCAHSFVVGWESQDYMGTAVIGAERAHPLMRHIIAAVPAARADFTYPHSTGPAMLSRALWHAWGHVEGLVALPPVAFYPYPYWKRDDPAAVAGPFPESYAVHRWAWSWRS